MPSHESTPTPAAGAAPWRASALAVAAYALVTAIQMWEVLPHLTTRLVHDELDPLLIAAILQWNASHVPFTDAWWQFPIFHPVRDALAFSEHLLGVSVLAAPIAWITGHPILTANLAVLLTFPLCGWASFALARHLTGSASAAFVAGLVFAFGPYRMSQLAHLQMLSAQWAPVALVSLHRFIDTGRRRWLWAFGASWVLQALSNGYALFFLSVFVGLWLLWFVVGQRRWRDLATVLAAWSVAALPLAPILFRYVRVHAANGFVRGPAEAANYSADVMGLLCAPYEVSLWGWLQYGCRGEGVLFPGLVTTLLCVDSVWLFRDASASVQLGQRRWLVVLRRLLLGVGMVQVGSAVVTMTSGPWKIALGPLVARSTTPATPMALGVMAMTAAYVLSPTVWAAARRAQVQGFYLSAALVMWLCALGPAPVVLGEGAEVPGLFALLNPVPGFDSLRVPSRFWLMATLCLAILVAFVVSRLLALRSLAWRRTALVALSVLVLSDGWEVHVPSGLVPPGPPNAELLRGEQVLYLPAGNPRDVFPTFYSVVQGWRSVNGYSGFEPTHYDGVRQGAKLELDGLLSYYRTRGNLHVVVAADAPRLAALVERQPGAVRAGQSSTATQYRLPVMRADLASAFGHVLPLAGATASCPPSDVLIDHALGDIWTCEPQMGRESVTLTLSAQGDVRALRLTQGRPVEFARRLRVDTSSDGTSWTIVYEGDIVGPFIEAALDGPKAPVVVVPLQPSQARLVRLQQMAHDPASAWSLREIEVLGREIR